MMEQVPLPLMLYDGMMGRPSCHWLQNASSVRERTKWVVPNSIAQVMRISRRVRKIIFAVVLVHPGGFEEATIVVRSS